jgi:hypothetical protein
MPARSRFHENEQRNGQCHSALRSRLRLPALASPIFVEEIQRVFDG